MINILLVEDNQDKINSIKKIIFENCLFPEYDVKTVSYLNEARSIIQDIYFDLMILDIQLPECVGATIRKDAGIAFLKEIISSNRFKRPHIILSLSEFDESLEEYSVNFRDSIFAIEKYDNFSDLWQRKLIQTLEHLFFVKESKTLSDVEYKYDFGIVCALRKELESVLALNLNWRQMRLYKDEDTIYYLGSFTVSEKKYSIVCTSPNEMGGEVTSIATLKLHEFFKPRYIFMTGIIAGVKGITNIGDVLVADPSWNYGLGKYIVEGGERRFHPTASHVRPSSKLKSIIEELAYDSKLLNEIHQAYRFDKPTLPPEIHLGPVGSGDAVIADEDKIREIIGLERKLLGVDMEVYGFYLSSSKTFKPKPDFIALKSVADFADDSKNDKYHNYCSFVTAQLLENLIMRKIVVSTPVLY